MKIGSHVSNNGNLMLVGSVQEALSYGANCFMVYLGAPQNTVRKPISEMRVAEALQLAKANGIQPQDIIVHAPYIVNLAQPDPEKRDFAIRFLTQEVKGTAEIGATYLVLHPGAHVGFGSEQGIARIAEGINEIIARTPTVKTVIALETMAGKGTECGRSFEEIAAIIEKVTHKARIGVCLDTCHIHDAGYDVMDHYQDVIATFDKIIGLTYLKVIHMNDTKNPREAHKDRHENFGFGYLGFQTLMQFFYDKRFEYIPKILETPYIPVSEGESYPPYKYEIAMIQSGEFDSNLKEKIIKHYQGKKNGKI